MLVNTKKSMYWNFNVGIVLHSSRGAHPSIQELYVMCLSVIMDCVSLTDLPH